MWIGYNGRIEEDVHNNYKAYGIKSNEINKIEEIIMNNTDTIMNMWADHFGVNEISVKDSLNKKD